VKLRLKILILVIGVLVISLGALAVPVYWYTRTALEHEFDQRLLLTLQLAEQNLNRSLLSALAEEPALSKVQNDVEEQLQHYTSREILGIGVYAGSDNPVARSGRPFPEPSLLPEMTIFHLSETDSSRESVSEIYRTGRHQYVKYAIRRFDTGNRIPVFVIAWGEVQFMSYFDQLKGSLFWMTLVAITVAVVLVILFSRNLINPVERLAGYAKSIQDNLNTEPVDLKRSDELGDLNRALTEMHTELRNTEQQNKQLLSGIAHEIKNPLGGLEIYTGLLEEELGEENRHKDYFRKISQALNNLNQTVTSYLDYARPQKSELQQLSVSTVIEDVLSLIQPELDQHQIRFQMNGNATLSADESKLRRIFLNLIKNAAQAIPGKNGEIVVEILEQDGQAQITIQDNGEGITPDHLDMIFEPYFTTGDKGYGLGLPIVKNLTEELGGTIFVQSDLGNGTIFKLTFPRADNDTTT